MRRTRKSATGHRRLLTRRDRLVLGFVYFVLQRQFVSGLTLGANKG